MEIGTEVEIFGLGKESMFGTIVEIRPFHVGVEHKGKVYFMHPNLVEALG